MAFTRTNNVVGNNTGSGTSLNAASFNATAGRLIVGGFSHESADTTLTATDTGSDTFTNGIKETHSGVDQWTHSFYDVSCNTQTTNVVAAGSSGSVPYRGISVAEYSAGAAIEFDVQNSAESTAATSVSAAVTTTGAAGVIHAVTKRYNSGYPTSGADDATLIEEHGSYHAHFQKITSSAALYTMTATIPSAGTSMTLTVVAFKEAAAGGTVGHLIGSRLLTSRLTRSILH